MIRSIHRLILVGLLAGSFAIISSTSSSGGVAYVANCWAGCDGSAHFYTVVDEKPYQLLHIALDVSPERALHPTSPPGPAHPIGSQWFLTGGDFNLTGIIDPGNGLSPAVLSLTEFPLISNSYEAMWLIDMTQPGIFYPSVSAFAYMTYRYRDGEGNGFSERSPTFEISHTFSPVTIAAVPGPIVGAGLPCILMAIAGLIGWRRAKRSHALTAEVKAAGGWRGLI